MTNRTVRYTYTGKEKAEVIIDLSDGGDGRARVARGRFLIDGNGGTKASNGIDVGLVHDTEEHTGVGAERFDVAALAFGVDSIKSKTRLARAGEASDDDELVAGDV